MDVVVDSWNKYNRSPHSHFIDDDICRFKRGHSIQKTYRILEHDYRDFQIYLIEKSSVSSKNSRYNSLLTGKAYLGGPDHSSLNYEWGDCHCVDVMLWIFLPVKSILFVLRSDFCIPYAI